LTHKKGDRRRKDPRKARPGNKNTVEGPRLGRHGKEATPLPQPRPAAKLPQRRRRPKTGGRDFVKGQNSHDGEVFRRTEDQLPRGNGTLMLKIAFHDYRERIYKSLGKLVDKPTGALLFLRDYIDRTEGRPTKKVEKTVHRSATFVFTDRDGTEHSALPETVGGDVTPAAASAEDEMILGLQPVRL
jgi:hypothetical protein